jgi:hypothetical protein
MSPDERIARAHRARQAMEEFFDPRAPDIIARLAQGIKVARQVRAQIEAHIADGAVAQKEKADAERLGDMTPAKRRLLAIGQ